MNGGDRFFSPTRGEITLDEIVVRIASFLREDREKQYQVIIGSDSQSRGKVTELVVAIVVHRRGNGGIYFWSRKRKNQLVTLRQRIYEEALLSLEVAGALVKRLNEQRILDCNLEIHVDIGQNGKTKSLVKEVVGLIQGNGFRVKTKPEAYGASTVADWHT